MVLLSLLALHRYQVISLWTVKVSDGEWTLDAPPVAEEAAEEAAPDEKPIYEKQLAVARAEIEKWQTRFEKAEQKTREAQGALSSAKDNFARETHELRARLKQEENRFVREHEKLEEDERLLDRTTRKIKSAEKQVEELEHDNKRLKKQVRQQQEISEELQKEIAALKAQIEELEDELKNGPPKAGNQNSRARYRAAQNRARFVYARSQRAASGSHGARFAHRQHSAA